MADRNSGTAVKIQQAAIEEFQKYGFEGASLRQIVKKAGVTTGAFYGYYKSKEELFESFVEEPARELRELIFSSFYLFFKNITADSGVRYYDTSMMPRLVDYILERKLECDLLFRKSKGTRYESFVCDIIKNHQERLEKHINKLHQRGVETNPVSPVLNRLIVKKMYETFFNLIVSDLPPDEIRICAMNIIRFHINGWEGLLIPDAHRKFLSRR